ncbi:MAG TPA: hypothetical protein VES42_16165, partial [Pilimelia sp.]|nr:hypothetical protein [Pilimelia sp.]
MSDDGIIDGELVTSPGHGAVAVFQAPTPARPRLTNGRPATPPTRATPPARGSRPALPAGATHDPADIDSPFL